MVLNGLPAYILRVGAAEVMPPPPPAYFNDFAGIVPQNVASALNSQLANFERLTSDQILVVIYPSMQSDSSVEDYTLRVARSWKAGQKARDNGAVLFVFVQNHKMFIEVGYGLEGVLPDALCKRIIDLDIVPQFKRGDFSSGLTSGVNAILAAIQGEYKGTGQTVTESRHEFGGGDPKLHASHSTTCVFRNFYLHQPNRVQSAKNRLHRSGRTSLCSFGKYVDERLACRGDRGYVLGWWRWAIWRW